MFRFSTRFDLFALTACLLVTAALGIGWYLERLNVRDANVRAGHLMRAYLVEVAKNGQLNRELEGIKQTQGD
jgi:hypothetical protein